ncbi:hypothetical protein CVD19_24145 [Bacillus sp. T33-2]|nr:hypothetical protein CVD19_24145 [Bacillus sp. T33-2]
MCKWFINNNFDYTLGSGKTTLLHHILKRGEGLVISHKAVIGAYEQRDYQFDKDETVLDYRNKGNKPGVRRFLLEDFLRVNCETLQNI